ncbi:hypothetical protein K440DRAFT_639001 [Wilcoxina mikolae CBS 423.85]|nr:hypothetical protein K440DRAFT_639001 [Wilcoxina mikolae CBS 423.85]
MPLKDKTGKPKQTDTDKTKKTLAKKNDKANDKDKDKHKGKGSGDKAPAKSKTEKEIEAKQKQLNETKAKADEDVKNRKTPLKGKSKLQKEVAALEAELAELKKKDKEEKANKKEKDEKKKKEEEKKKKEQEKKRKEAEKNKNDGEENDDNNDGDSDEDDGSPKKSKAQLADEAKQARIVRKLQKEWENRDAEAEKQANFEKAKKAALRKRNEKQRIADQEAERRYHEESDRREAEKIKEQRAEGERMLQQNHANVPWPLEGTVKRKPNLSKEERAEIDERFQHYIRDEYPHRLQAYLLRNENAAEIFRTQGGPMLRKRVEELYNEQLQNLPHTWYSGLPEQDALQRVPYEQRRGTWHALLDRYYHATGWPPRSNTHWTQRTELQRLMHDSKRFTETARLSNERIKMCRGNAEGLRMIFREIFLGIGFRKTRNRLTRHIPGAPPRSRPSKTPERDADGNIIKTTKKTNTDGNPTKKKKKAYFTTSKWLKRNKKVVKRKASSKDDDEEDDSDVGDTQKESEEPEKKKQKTGKAPKTGKVKGKGKEGQKMIEVPVEIVEEPGEVSDDGDDGDEDYDDLL